MDKISFEEVIAKLNEEKAIRRLRAKVISTRVMEEEDEKEHYCSLTLQRSNGEDTFIIKSCSHIDFLNGIYGFVSAGHIGVTFLKELFDIIGFSLEDYE